MVKDIDKIAAGLGAKVIGKVPHTGGALSVPPGWRISLPPFRPGSSLDKVFAQAGQPMRAGCGIPRYR